MTVYVVRWCAFPDGVRVYVVLFVHVVCRALRAVLRAALVSGSAYPWVCLVYMVLYVCVRYVCVCIVCVVVHGVCVCGGGAYVVCCVDVLLRCVLCVLSLFRHACVLV